MWIFILVYQSSSRREGITTPKTKRTCHNIPQNNSVWIQAEAGFVTLLHLLFQIFQQFVMESTVKQTQWKPELCWKVFFQLYGKFKTQWTATIKQKCRTGKKWWIWPFSCCRGEMRMLLCTSQARASQDLLWRSNNGKALLLEDDVPWEPKISVFIQVSLRKLLLLGMCIDMESKIWGCIRRRNIKYSLCGKWTENPIVLHTIYSLLGDRKWCLCFSAPTFLFCCNSVLSTMVLPTQGCSWWHCHCREVTLSNQFPSSHICESPKCRVRPSTAPQQSGLGGDRSRVLSLGQPWAPSCAPGLDALQGGLQRLCGRKWH